MHMLANELLLHGRLPLQQPIHGLVAVRIDVDGAFHTADFPQGREFATVRQRKLAALVDDASDDHSQSTTHPRFVARVEHFVEPDVLGQIKQSLASPQLARMGDLELVRGKNATPSRVSRELAAGESRVSVSSDHRRATQSGRRKHGWTPI